MRARWTLALAVGILAGCAAAQFDIRPEGDTNRVVTGTVELGDAGPLAAEAKVVVRVIDAAQSDYRAPTAVLGEPSVEPPRTALPPRVLGEQLIADAKGSSIPFRVAYRATDEQLRIGLVLDARISVGRKVEYYTVNGYSLNLRNADEPHALDVNRAGR
ncbi:MAG: hypothetical protein ACREFX_00375 [Opitutaceae bacterium]